MLTFDFDFPVRHLGVLHNKLIELKAEADKTHSVKSTCVNVLGIEGVYGESSGGAYSNEI